MMIILPAAILVASIMMMVFMQRRDIRRGMIWSVAAIGSIAAIIASLFLIKSLPLELVFRSGKAAVFNPLGLTLMLDATAWSFQITLLAILSAVMLTAARRPLASGGSTAWLGTMGIALVGLFSIQSGSLSTLLSAWFLIDMIELVLLLTSRQSTQDLGKTVVGYLLRFSGILVALATVNLPATTLATRPDVFILLAIMIRMGALPFWPHWSDIRLQRGLGIIITAVRISSLLVPLSRLAPGSVPSLWEAYLTVYCLLMMYYCAVQWLGKGAIQDKPVYWYTGYGLVTCMCVIHGQSPSLAMWGVTALVCGSSLFLMSEKSGFYLALSLAGLIAMTGLPFTPVSSSWSGLLGSPVDWRATPFLGAHALFLAGYLRQAFKVREGESGMEGLARFAYPAGLTVLLLTPWVILLVSGLETPLLDWWAGFITFALFLILLLIFRAQLFEDAGFKLPETRYWRAFKKTLDGVSVILKQDWLFSFFDWSFDRVGRITASITNILEGDGGVLWVFLLLALFATLLARMGS